MRCKWHATDFPNNPSHNVDILGKSLYDVSRLLPLVKGAEKMKRLALLLQRGVLKALSAFAVINLTLLVNTSAFASVRMDVLR